MEIIRHLTKRKETRLISQGTWTGMKRKELSKRFTGKIKFLFYFKDIIHNLPLLNRIFVIGPLASLRISLREMSLTPQ